MRKTEINLPPLSAGFYGVLAFILCICSETTIGGGLFDYYGYMRTGLAREIVIGSGATDKNSRVVKFRHEACRKYKYCVGLRITGIQAGSGIAEKLIIAMADPCRYSSINKLEIRTPDISKDKAFQYINGNAYFCNEKIDDGSVFLSFEYGGVAELITPVNVMVFGSATSNR